MLLLFSKQIQIFLIFYLEKIKKKHSFFRFLIFLFGKNQKKTQIFSIFYLEKIKKNNQKNRYLLIQPPRGGGGVGPESRVGRPRFHVF